MKMGVFVPLRSFVFYYNLYGIVNFIWIFKLITSHTECSVKQNGYIPLYLGWISVLGEDWISEFGIVKGSVLLGCDTVLFSK